MTLACLLAREHVAYQVRPITTPAGDKKRLSLWLAASRNGVTLPFYQGSCAELVNIRRGRWEAKHPFDGRTLATGCSLRDVVRATIQAVWA
ncbi:MAG: hypothetical protein Q8N51_18890 [Gammaproteobacteria bacterium]|nr:hypothetical protein [Gammaproteobacteria bacterium]